MQFGGVEFTVCGDGGGDGGAWVSFFFRRGRGEEQRQETCCRAWQHACLSACHAMPRHLCARCRGSLCSPMRSAGCLPAWLLLVKRGRRAKAAHRAQPVCCGEATNPAAHCTTLRALPPPAARCALGRYLAHAGYAMTRAYLREFTPCHDLRVRQGPGPRARKRGRRGVGRATLQRIKSHPLVAFASGVFHRGGHTTPQAGRQAGRGQGLSACLSSPPPPPNHDTHAFHIGVSLVIMQQRRAVRSSLPVCPPVHMPLCCAAAHHPAHAHASPVGACWLAGWLARAGGAAALGAVARVHGAPLLARARMRLQSQHADPGAGPAVRLVMGGGGGARACAQDASCMAPPMVREPAPGQGQGQVV